jgi:hypothetical protein
MTDIELVIIEQLARDLIEIWSRPWWAIWRRRPTEEEMVEKLRLALIGERSPLYRIGLRKD